MVLATSPSPFENPGRIGNAGPVSPCPLRHEGFPVRAKQTGVDNIGVDGRMCFLPAAEQRRCQPAKSRADDRANHRHRAAERRAKGRTGQRGAGAPCAKPRSKAAGNAAVLVLGSPNAPPSREYPSEPRPPYMSAEPRESPPDMSAA